MVAVRPHSFRSEPDCGIIKNILSGVMTNEPTFATRIGLALATCSGVAFGTMSIFAKLAYDRGASALPLLAARFAFATLLLGAFHVATGRTMMIGRRNVLQLLLLGAFGYGFEASLFFLALEHAPAGVVGLIFYSFPLWTNALGIATGIETFSARVLVALVLGTAGVASIFTVSDSGLAGPVLALAAAVAVAVYLLLAQVLMRDIPATSFALWTGAGAAVSVGAAALVAGWELPVATVPHAAAMGLVSALAFALLYAAIARIGSGRAAIANMVEPITTVALAWVVLAEDVTLRIAVGALLVLSALPILATTGARDDLVSVVADASDRASP
jgi:drug/metabolite transporter (DMT)-like permease